MRLLRILFCLTFAGCTASSAFADSFTFSFGGTTDDFSGSGTLTANLSGAGPYAIQSITGTTTELGGPAAAIVGLDGYLGSDNELFYSAGTGYTFDSSGVSYYLANGSQVNLSDFYGFDLASLQEDDPSIDADSELTSFVITANASASVTPEPGSFVLLGTGLAGMLGFGRRYFNRPA
jgi:hypothetical protein